MDALHYCIHTVCCPFSSIVKLYRDLLSCRSSCAEGIPPLVIAEPLLDGDEREREDLQLHIPPELQFLYKVHIVLLRAMSAMARQDLKSYDCDAGSIRSLISIFDAQLFSLVSSSPSELSKLQRS